LDTGFPGVPFKPEQLNEKRPGHTADSQSRQTGIEERIVVDLTDIAPDPSGAYEIEVLSSATRTGSSYQFFFFWNKYSNTSVSLRHKLTNWCNSMIPI
jgi:hypothetical protein